MVKEAPFIRVSRSLLLRAVFALTLVLGSPLITQACGISWAMPPTPFYDGGNGDYRFAYWESWGKIKVSEKLTIPVQIGFSPIPNHQSSRILGVGWSFPLLESICIPTSKEKYKLVLPDGIIESLDVRPAHQLEGKGWLGQITGRSITLTASCGTVLIYRDGRLLQIKTEGAVLDFSSSAEGAYQVNANGRTILKLNRRWDPNTTQKIHTLDFSGKHGLLKIGCRTMLVVETVQSGGKAVEYERKTDTESLVSVKFDGEPERCYDFKPDGLTLGRHPYQWDARAQLIRAGDEKYSFKQVHGLRCFQTEFKDGTKTLEGRNKIGTTLYKPRNEETLYVVERVLFNTHDQYAYKTRKKTAIKNGKEEVLERYWYDENGSEIRSLSKRNGEIIERIKNVVTSKNETTGKLSWEKEYDSQGKIIRFRHENKTYIFSHLEKEPFILVSLLSPSGKKTEKKIPAHAMNAFLEKL